MNFFLIFISFILFYFLNNYLKDRNLIINYKGQKHQKFLGSKDIPLSGGIFLVYSIIVLFSYYNFFLSFFIFLIFCVGFTSDINFLSSPKLRLLIQSLIIICFVLILDVKINETNFLLLDKLLENIYFRYFFSVFCLLILINGSNFIDGLNGLLLGYFSLIISIILYLNSSSYFGVEKNIIFLLLLSLIYLFILNINNKLFMGDSGSYTLGLISGFFLIKLHEFNNEVSPYFIVLLLWYPCFENLFSIIRKFSFKKSPVNADNNHLHQLLYYYLKKNKVVTKFSTNNASSFLIILYNLFVFTLSLNYLSNTRFQIIMILVNITIYLVTYFKLFAFKYKINSSY
jgi:UDP-N-acetylmuramyl pentapeptide phosphotransferase/UDP-N-acetylglucosamine-1-phosphate transferase